MLLTIIFSGTKTKQSLLWKLGEIYAISTGRIRMQTLTYIMPAETIRKKEAEIRIPFGKIRDIIFN